MTAREILKAAYEADKAISDLKTQRAHYMDLATGTTAAMDRVGGFGQSSGSSKIESCGVARADIAAKLEARIAEYNDLIRDAILIIDRLPKARHQRVLRLRYLCGMSWPEITDEMGYTDEKSAYRIHGWALKEAEKVWSDYHQDP